MTTWSREHPFWTPSSTIPSIEKKVANTQDLRPLLEISSLPLELNVDQIIAVPALLQSTCPAAVAWRVVLVVVNAVQAPLARVLGWVSHVCREVLKLQPSFANGDAASSVAVIPVSLGVEASFLHCSPSAVGLGAFPLLPLRPDFSLKASTTLNPSRVHGTRLDLLDGSAGTLASGNPVLSYNHLVNDGKAAE